MTAPERTADSRLVARSLEGDFSAFEEIYAQHASRLYTLAVRMLGNAADAEDLLQEIFLTAYRKLASFRGNSSLGTWLYRLGVNACLDHLRSRGARNRQRTESLEADDSPVMSTTDQALSLSQFDLERAIRALPPAARTAFVLHDVEGFAHHEIAEMLGVAVGTSKSQVHKARLRIREYLLQSDAGPSAGTGGLR
jgi:RNA polymerase sigma-70 factor (ECF subfamily)